MFLNYNSKMTKLNSDGDIIFNKSKICEKYISIKRGNARFDYYSYGGLSNDRHISDSVRNIIIMITIDEAGVDYLCYYYCDTHVKYYKYEVCGDYCLSDNKVFRLNNLSVFQQHRIGRTAKHTYLC